MAGGARARHFPITFVAGLAVIIALVPACTAASSTQDSVPNPATGSSARATSGERPASASAATAGSSALDAAEADRRVGIILGASSRYRELIRAILVMVDGQSVVERYGVNGGPDVTGNTYSVTDSVMSMLIGIAIDEGSIDGVDQTLGELLPTYVPVMAPGVSEVTLRQVLTMTGGIKSDEADLLNPSDVPDWVAGILSTPLEQPAGSGWAYSSRGSHLLSAILVESTGRPVLDYARERLFGPLGISSEPAAQPTAVGLPPTEYDDVTGFAWSVDPQGYSLGFSDLKITPTEMAKLGQLYLDDGRVGDQQVVPADWVAQSTQIAPGTQYDTSGYGYQWYIDDVDGHRAFSAAGSGGQLIEVIPELGLVVVVSCVNGPGAFEPYDLMEIIRAQILPVVTG